MNGKGFLKERVVKEIIATPFRFFAGAAGGLTVYILLKIFGG